MDSIFSQRYANYLFLNRRSIIFTLSMIGRGAIESAITHIHSVWFRLDTWKIFSKAGISKTIIINAITMAKAPHKNLFLNNPVKAE